MTTVQLGDLEVELRPPASFTVRWEIIAYQNKNALRAKAAALAACWRGRSRPKVKLGQVDYSIGQFGGAVFDELCERGLRLADIMAAGTVAMDLLADGLVGEDELEEAADTADFSEGEEASTGSSSTSSGSGDSAPAG